MKIKTAWKVLDKGMVSNSDNSFKWKKGKWYKHEGKISICNSGFHASKLLFDAVQYVPPGIICKVEYQGKIIKREDKFVCADMRIIKTYRFTKRMAVEWAIFCAKLCLSNFEKEFPDDKRPREAIEAAEKWLKNPSKKNKYAVWSAAKAVVHRCASSASSAAKYAGFAAGSTARYARYAVDSAWCAGLDSYFTERKMNNKLLKIIGEKQFHIMEIMRIRRRK